MEEKYKKLFGYINLIEPPKGLGAHIVSFVENEEKRLAKFKKWIFGSSSLASFGFMLWAGVYLAKNIQETGLWQYFSLLFSENGSLLTYWHEFSLSIVESLPIVSIILFLAAAGMFIWSFANATKKNVTVINNLKFN